MIDSLRLVNGLACKPTQSNRWLYNGTGGDDVPGDSLQRITIP